MFATVAMGRCWERTVSVIRSEPTPGPARWPVLFSTGELKNSVEMVSSIQLGKTHVKQDPTIRKISVNVFNYNPKQML